VRLSGIRGQLLAYASSSFKSPFGIWGALYSYVVFVLAFVGSIGGFQGHGLAEATDFVVLVAIITILYFGFVKKTPNTISKKKIGAAIVILNNKSKN
jgi:hypothetical protein